MSLEAAIARVDEIRTMLTPATAARAPQASDNSSLATAAPAPGSSFASALTTALDSSATSSASTPSYANPIAAYDTSSGDDAGGDSGDTDFDPEIQASSAREGVDPALVRAIIGHESGFNANATSSVGAQGLMQLMPGTARGLGVTDSYDPAQNIAGGTHLIRTLLDRYDGNLSLALAAYSAGPGAVDRFGGIPPYGETQAYVRDVTASYQRTTSERNTG
jgi:soluble lytic murein transglycosylase-like protein